MENGASYFNTTTVYSPNNSVVSLVTGYMISGQASGQIQMPVVRISDTSITRGGYGGINVTNNALTTFANNEISIYRVVGYR